MKIRWEANDGYVGGSRPHYLTVPDSELEGLSEKEQDEVIEAHVQHDFDEKVSYSWSRV